MLTNVASSFSLSVSAKLLLTQLTIPERRLMYLATFSDEELVQYAKRVSVWLSPAEKAQIATEINRRTPAGREKSRQARREALKEQWRHNGGIVDATGQWTVPFELMWRSLPAGEDR